MTFLKQDRGAANAQNKLFSNEAGAGTSAAFVEAGAKGITTDDRLKDDKLPAPGIVLSCFNDIRHRFVVSAIWSVPFAKNSSSLVWRPARRLPVSADTRSAWNAVLAAQA